MASLDSKDGCNVAYRLGFVSSKGIGQGNGTSYANAGNEVTKCEEFVNSGYWEDVFAARNDCPVEVFDDAFSGFHMNLFVGGDLLNDRDNVDRKAGDFVPIFSDVL